MNRARSHRALWIFVSIVVLWAAGCAKKESQPSVAGEDRTSDKGITISLVANGAKPKCGDVDQPNVKLSKSHDKHNHVRWLNTTPLSQKIYFSADHWSAIFMEPHEAGFEVLPGQYTQWFTVKPGTDTLTRPYNVFPLREGCPPTEPSVSAEP